MAGHLARDGQHVPFNGIDGPLRLLKELWGTLFSIPRNGAKNSNASVNKGRLYIGAYVNHVRLMPTSRLSNTKNSYGC